MESLIHFHFTSPYLLKASVTTLLCPSPLSLNPVALLLILSVFALAHFWIPCMAASSSLKTILFVIRSAPSYFNVFDTGLPCSLLRWFLQIEFNPKNKKKNRTNPIKIKKCKKKKKKTIKKQTKLNFNFELQTLFQVPRWRLVLQCMC